MARGIYKRGNIYWIRYAGLDGKTIYESSCSHRFKDAEKLLIQRRQEIKEGKRPQLRATTDYKFKELAVEYLDWAERQRSFHNKKKYINHFVEIYGHLPLRRFNTRLLEQFQTKRIKHYGNKPATVNRYIATIKHMFTKAKEWGMLGRETLEEVQKVGLLEELNWRLRFLSVEECQELIDACDYHLRPILVTALNTGLRKSELLQLTWDNVDLKHGFILLEMTKNGKRREIPLNDTVREALLARRSRLDVPYVFYDSKTETL